MTTMVTTLTGIDVVGDGYDLVYLDDKCISRGDGNYEYTSGAADALEDHLNAERQYVTLDITDEFAQTEAGDEYAVQNWWEDLEDSSLEGVITAAREYGLAVRISTTP